MAKKMKTNQDGGGKSSTAAAGELRNNQKGAAKYDVKKGSHDHPHGASRMGYNQSFGAARVSGYSKGAAKVADIMSFGASKYMKHGAADAGHGGPAGHEHASMTTKKRSTSGGGSSSSSSSTSGTSNYDAVVKSEGTRIVDPSKITPAMTAAANKKRADAKKLDAASSSTSSGGGSSTTSSKTIVSPNSMAETQLQGEIKAENRSQRLAFSKAETNIRAGNDSITASNQFLDKLPNFKQSLPKVKRAAGIIGGKAAQKRRVSSGDFSPKEALQTYKAGQSK